MYGVLQNSHFPYFCLSKLHMKKAITFLFFISIFLCSKATDNYWVGSGQSANWSDAGNWANGVPTFNDTVFF
jgi:hypothetical protein